MRIGRKDPTSENGLRFRNNICRRLSAVYFFLLRCPLLDLRCNQLELSRLERDEQLPCKALTEFVRQRKEQEKETGWSGKGVKTIVCDGAPGQVGGCFGRGFEIDHRFNTLCTLAEVLLQPPRNSSIHGADEQNGCGPSESEVYEHHRNDEGA